MIFPEYYYEMNELAVEIRDKWGVNEYTPIDIFSLVFDKIKNLTIVFMDLNNEISGACIKILDQNAIIINSKHSLGRQRFTLAHEIYHLNFDNGLSKFCGIFEKNDVERKADNFAASLLMPHRALIQYKKENNISEWNIDNIIQTEQYFQISHNAMLWRIRNLEEISFKQYQDFKKYSVLNASSQGYDLKLYEPFLTEDFFTIGNYIKLTEDLYEKDAMSFGKKEELLLGAYRSDMVFDIAKLEKLLE